MRREDEEDEAIAKALRAQFEEAGIAKMSESADEIWKELMAQFEEVGTTVEEEIERLKGEQRDRLREIQFREKAAREKEALTAQTYELAMLVRRLAHLLDKAAPDNHLSNQARDYLRKHGLDGIPVREVPADEEIREFFSMKNHYLAIVELSRELRQADKDKAHLAMLVRRLAQRLEKGGPDILLGQKAIDYLRSHGLDDGTPA